MPPSTRFRHIPYVLPATVLVVGGIYYAIVFTGVISTWSWNGISPTHQDVGAGNYLRLLSDPVFWRALLNTAVYALSIPFILGIGMVAAVMTASRLRGRSIARVMIFVPVVLSPAVMAPVFRASLAPDGTVNELLRSVGLGSLAHPWLADPSTALLTLMAINVWSATGLAFIFYSAALTAIDAQVIEAARLDGVGNARMFFSLIIPLTRGTTAALLVLNTVGLLKTFEIPFLVTSGGPANATQFLGTYLYQQSIANFNFGYGAAIACVIVFLAILLSAWQLVRYRQEASR